MADKSEIQWTDASWNPIVGCSIVSPGCTNCYAMKMAARIERMHDGKTHYAGTTKDSKGGAVWTGLLTMAPDRILEAPLRWKRGRKIFVNSMGDLHHESVRFHLIDKVVRIMAQAPHHTFQLLTKRAEGMHAYWSDPELAERIGATIPLPNVWLGVSTERQKEANERIPHLLRTPAAVRFISAEPLLGSIDLAQAHRTMDRLPNWPTPTRVDWVIVGGESGPRARSMHLEWARDIVLQCRKAGVPVFMKQLGSRPMRDNIARPFKVTGAGGDMQEWEGSLRYRQFPEPAA